MFHCSDHSFSQSIRLCTARTWMSQFYTWGSCKASHFSACKWNMVTHKFSSYSISSEHCFHFADDCLCCFAWLFSLFWEYWFCLLQESLLPLCVRFNQYCCSLGSSCLLCCGQPFLWTSCGSCVFFLCCLTELFQHVFTQGVCCLQSVDYFLICRFISLCVDSNLHDRSWQVFSVLPLSFTQVWMFNPHTSSRPKYPWWGKAICSLPQH